jgi:S1-C subfamily serine protease
MISKGLLLRAVTAVVMTTPTAGASVLTALQVDAIAQQTKDVNGQNLQRDESPQLSVSEIDAIASQTTVVIGQDLKKGDIEARREFNPGSGVLVAKRGNTYYVATNLHVVRGRGGFYGVRTYDGEVYPVDDETTRSNINFLGEEDEDYGATIRGFDLAIVRFQSDKNYPLATINLDKPRQGDQVFTSGWPDPDNQSPRRQRSFAPGDLIGITAPASDGGYNLSYSCPTRRGMSGGPVFNANGEMVAIHGRTGEANAISNLGVQVAYLMNQTESAQAPAFTPREVKSFNLGIQVTYMMDQAKKIQPLAGILPNLEFSPAPVKPSLISNGMRNRPRTADVIDDIYETFSRNFKPAAVRDCPSGGSRTVLLGSSEERCEDQ